MHFAPLSRYCADPGFFIRGGGGGGGAGPTARKIFLVLNLFWGPMVLLQRKLYFSTDPEGVQHFPGGGGGSYFFPGGGG